MTAEFGLKSPYEASLFARGKMTSEATQRVSSPWVEAFLDRIPSGWEDGEIAANDIVGAQGERLSQELVLAGLTHPNKEVRLITAANQNLTVMELAVGMFFDDDGSLTPRFIISQVKRGLSVMLIAQAASLTARADTSHNLADLFRGNF